MNVYVGNKELKNAYIGEYKTTKTYYIRNMPGDNSNVYVAVAEPGKTIKSVTYEGTFSQNGYSGGFFLRISGSNNKNQRYGFSLKPNNTSTIDGYLSSESSVDFHVFGNGFNGNYSYKAVISRTGVSITLNGTTYNFTFDSTESNVVNTIMDSSTMNVYGSRYDSYVTASDITVNVTYS